jgi:hypothetical protein
MPVSLVTEDQIAAVNEMMEAKWKEHGGKAIMLDGLPIPPTPADMTPEHDSRSIAVDISTIEDSMANYRMARFGYNVDVSVLFYNLEIMIVDADWFPDPEESFLLRLRPSFGTAEEAFGWIRSGVFMMFNATADSVLVLDGDYRLKAEWSLADDFARCQNPKDKEQLNIHLNCNEHMSRENKEVARIKGIQEEIKAFTGYYPHEVFKERWSELSGNKPRGMSNTKAKK